MSAEVAAFDSLVTLLNFRWKLHKDLFQGSEKIALFSESGSRVWWGIDESVMDSVFMDISRLLDPPKSVGKSNLSISRMLDSIGPNKYLKILGTNYEEAENLYKKMIQPWRNRKLSHNDLETALTMGTLPNVDYSKIDELVSKINEVARFVSLSINDVDRSFPPLVTGSAWTNRLFRVLREGIEALPPSMRKK